MGSVPSIVPQAPQIDPQSQQGPVNIKAVLELPDFHLLPPDRQQQLLAERYNPKLAKLTKSEFALWKQQSAKLVGAKIPVIEPTRMDKAIEFARPFVSDAVGAGAGALAGPETLGMASVPVGLGAKAAIDALLQHMESTPPQSMSSEAMGLEPGGAASTLVNSGQMVGTNAILGKVLGMFGKGARQAATPNVQFLGQKAATQEIPTVVKDLLKSGADNLGKEAANSTWKQYALANGVSLPIGLMMHSVLPTELATGGLTALKVGRAGVKTLLENPRTAAILEAMQKGAPLGMKEEAAAKLLSDTLNGSGMVASGPDGDKAYVLKDGKLIPAVR